MIVFVIIYGNFYWIPFCLDRVVCCALCVVVYISLSPLHIASILCIVFSSLFWYSFQFLVIQVLHMDRNDYYGGESTSLNLNQVRILWTLNHKIFDLFSIFVMLQMVLIELFVSTALEEVQGKWPTSNTLGL